MRTLFRTWLAVAAMAMPVTVWAQAFDGTYVGVSLQGSGPRGCTTSAPAPRALTISGGVAQVTLGANGDIIYRGPVDAQGTMNLRADAGSLLIGRVEANGRATGQISNPACTYAMSWQKR